MPARVKAKYVVDSKGRRSAVILSVKEFEALVRELEDLPAASHSRPQPATQRGLQQKFRELAAKWRDETRFLSSATAMAVHPAYQQIIGMGKAAVPLILRELKKEPDHWFWALGAITGENPVPPEVAGDVQKMADAWLDYGRRQGYA